MRVIAGKYRSRLLQSLPGLDIRPTADRLRETLFNVLTAGNPNALQGTVWVDFYAGTGAVGIEALSRGAAKVHFVEASPPAAELIRKNLRAMGIESGFEVLRLDAIHALKSLNAGGVNATFIFLDPPYRLETEYSRILAALSSSQLINSGSLVIAEHQKKFDPGEEFGGLKRSRKLVQGDAALSFYRTA
jgi:16S rRNA (guanine(966)-N(2))-methyltransferase RsmD